MVASCSASDQDRCRSNALFLLRDPHRPHRHYCSASVVAGTILTALLYIFGVQRLSSIFWPTILARGETDTQKTFAT